MLAKPASTPPLTSFSHGAGCGCKLGSLELAQALAGLVLPRNDNLMVGTETRDDAAVYRLTADLALVVTADFFTPIVDDPVAYGAIAATNALSDIWAMGGQPVVCLNLVGFPREALPLEVLQRILAAGAAVAEAAGAVVAGGHTIDDPELKYGMSVVGTVHPDRLVRNTGAVAGDLLYLTKPIGTGLVSTAIKRDAASPEAVTAAIASMRTLNRAAAAAMLEAGVSAATDVTGFGLLGHLNELAEASGLAAELDSAAVPLLPEARALAESGMSPGGSKRNLKAAAAYTDFGTADSSTQLLLADAQTSGGLLLAIAPERAGRLEAELSGRGVPVHQVGRLLAGDTGRITVLAP